MNVERILHPILVIRAYISFEEIAGVSVTGYALGQFLKINKYKMFMFQTLSDLSSGARVWASVLSKKPADDASKIELLIHNPGEAPAGVPLCANVGETPA